MSDRGVWERAVWGMIEMMIGYQTTDLNWVAMSLRACFGRREEGRRRMASLASSMTRFFECFVGDWEWSLRARQA